MDVLERLRKLMDARGWTMYRLAKESGLTESTIANIYRRNAIPSIDTLEKICQELTGKLAELEAKRVPVISDLTGGGDKKKPVSAAQVLDEWFNGKQEGGEG